ncbi:heavy metal translocating P-type ATPase [Pelomicrobium sp.]|jgi:Cu2+-exporting ATPase|uniref:heavy metal translocating P-type ATPase n=1 Tax=Pelomicrobium sp. TaxID=2815319 RepID=UPI003FA7581B
MASLSSPDPSSSAATACFHCGLPVPQASRYAVPVDGVMRRLCCPGCEAVVRAIVAAGLESYYRHRSALPASPRDSLPEFLRELELYDAPKVQQGFVRAAGEHVREASLILEGIRCAACVWLNEQQLARLPGVLGVSVNYATQRARIRWDETRVRLSEILRAIAAIGYTAHPYDPSRHEAILRQERRRALWELFVAGFGMMQVMMLALPSYLAGEGEMPRDVETLLRWAALLLTVPVVGFSSTPFFRGAWNDLRARRLGMDVPVALGIGLAFAASVWATLTGEGEAYFDSITMFVFFLLGGRYLEWNARQRAADASEALARLRPAMAWKLSAYPHSGEETRVAVAELAPGDYVRVRPGEAVPADGVVAEGTTAVDEALLTGESRPVAKRPGDGVVGASLNVESPVVVRVERVGEETVLAGILRLLDRAAAEKPPIAAAADRVAAWFVAALLMVAAGVFLYWSSVEPERALWITVAVLVVTCPCALSLATPAALGAATSRLARKGLLVTRGHALETLAKATHVVFDKTGTLTDGHLTLEEVLPLGALPVEACLALAAGLEQGAEHPIGRALREAVRARGWTPSSGALPVRVPGAGMEAVIDGRRLRIGTPAFVAELVGQALPSSLSTFLEGHDTGVVLGAEDGYLAAFAFRDALRPDAAAAVAHLQAAGCQILLLSGDRPAAVRRVAERLGIERFVAGASPEEKLAWIERLQREGAVVAMVGDGVNDAPVLARAQVSVAVGEAAQAARASADMVLASGRLLDLADGFALARRATRVIYQNFTWAIAYNLGALPLAVAGFVTPWMAGLGMAGSSLLVVMNALRLARHGSEIGHRIVLPELGLKGLAHASMPKPSISNPDS